MQSDYYLDGTNLFLCMMNGLRAIPQPSELLYINQVKKFTKRRLTMGNTLDPAPQPSV